MVISCVIKGFLVHNVLVDTNSAAYIIFAKAFRQMQEQDDKIHDATHPLCGFGERQIVALGKITMPITSGYVHNTRTEQVVFDIVDMDYPYNAIIGWGTLNAFEAILHPTYLCLRSNTPYNISLLNFLFNNKDVFAWSANDLCGVNRDVIEHSLNVDPTIRPRKQKLRKMFDDKAEGARMKLKGFSAPEWSEK
jgi:hypothetical protein